RRSYRRCDLVHYSAADDHLLLPGIAEELAECLHVEVQDALYHLVEQRRTSTRVTRFLAMVHELKGHGDAEGRIRFLKLSILSSKSSWKAYADSLMATIISTRLPKTHSSSSDITFPVGRGRFRGEPI